MRARSRAPAESICTDEARVLNYPSGGVALPPRDAAAPFSSTGGVACTYRGATCQTWLRQRSQSGNDAGVSVAARQVRAAVFAKRTRRADPWRTRGVVHALVGGQAFADFAVVGQREAGHARGLAGLAVQGRIAAAGCADGIVTPAARRAVAVNLAARRPTSTDEESSRGCPPDGSSTDPRRCAARVSRCSAAARVSRRSTAAVPTRALGTRAADVPAAAGAAFCEARADVAVATTLSRDLPPEFAVLGALLVERLAGLAHFAFADAEPAAVCILGAARSRVDLVFRAASPDRVKRYHRSDRQQEREARACRSGHARQTCPEGGEMARAETEFPVPKSPPIWSLSAQAAQIVS